jgi:hypothetical protein
MAEKNRLTSVFSWRLHVPLASPHKVPIGWPVALSVVIFSQKRGPYTDVCDTDNEDKSGDSSGTDETPECPFE